MILGVILVLSGYYTWDNLAKLIKSGFSSTGPTAALFVFSVLYFGIMTDAGMFDVIIGKLMLLVKDSVVGVCIMTCIIALIAIWTAAALPPSVSWSRPCCQSIKGCICVPLPCCGSRCFPWAY